MLRTDQILPMHIVIPDDIPGLVAQVYNELSPDEKAYNAFSKEHERMIVHETNMKNRAVYRIREPERMSRYKASTLHGLLDRDLAGGDAAAEACVRDSGTSVEVIMMRRVDEDHVEMLTQKSDPISLSHEPDRETAALIAQQRIRLPYRLSAPWIIHDTIIALEKMTLSAREW